MLQMLRTIGWCRGIVGLIGTAEESPERHTTPLGPTKAIHAFESIASGVPSSASSSIITTLIHLRLQLQNLSFNIR